MVLLLCPREPDPPFNKYSLATNCGPSMRLVQKIMGKEIGITALPGVCWGTREKALKQCRDLVSVLLKRKRM